MHKRANTFKSYLWPMLLMAIAAPVSAHHSFGGYDMKKTITAEATIKEFRWGAPHSAAVFVIKNAKGKQEEVVVASAAPSMFVKQGFKPKDFRVGDKVEISWHPSRNGATGGILSTMKLPDGRTFKDTEFPAIQAAEAAKADAPPAQ